MFFKKSSKLDYEICSANSNKHTDYLLFKLSLRNAKRQAKDYLVYFATIIMAAALIYAFNGLVFSDELRELSSRMENLPIVIVFASIVVVCIFGWLVHYTTGFMLTRRSRELGTYMLIGLEPRQVTRLFLTENLIIGGSALALGILTGCLLYQILRAIALSLFGLPYQLSFSLSVGALGLTIFYFVLIYFFSQIRSRKRIRSMKIYDLIYYEKINEEAIIQKGGKRRKLFAVSIVFGVIGTLLLMMGQMPPALLGSACIILFLYGFFISFSSGVPAYFERRPEKKYQRQTLLVFRTLSAKLATMGVVMATISLLFTAVLITQGLGLIFNAILHSRAEQTCCFDLIITDTDSNVSFEEYLDYVHTNIPVVSELLYAVYLSEDSAVMDYISANTRYYNLYPKDTLMKYSDYAALRAMLKLPEAPLPDGKYLIHCSAYLKELMEKYDEPVILGGETLTPGDVYSELFSQHIWYGNGHEYILVVPDELTEDFSTANTNYTAMTTEPVSEAHFHALNKISEDRAGNDGDFIDTKAQEEADVAFGTTIIVFPLYYLALALTMTAATILTIHQLSETNRYRQQFALLRKLGMNRREMVRALRTQFAVYYAMPALPPIWIATPFMLNLRDSSEPGILTGIHQPAVILVMILLLFFIVYGCYILLAYTSLRRNVLS